MFTDAIVLSEVRKVREHLLPPRLESRGKWLQTFGFVAVGFLWLVALAKIVIALERGHHNVHFLFIMALAVAGVAWKVMADSMEARIFREVRERFATLLP